MLGIREKRTWLAPLQSIELFGHCGTRELERLDGLMTEITVSAGTRLISEGRRGSEFFVIRSGTATVTRRGHEVGRLEAGGFFGEMSLLDREPRTASVTALTDMRVWVMYRPDFAELMDRSPAIAEAVHRAAAERRSRLAHPSVAAPARLRRTTVTG